MRPALRRVVRPLGGSRRRRWSVIGVAGALVLAATVVGIVVTTRGDGGTASAATHAPPTVTVARGALRQVQTVPGDLGYGEPVTVTGHGDGTITWLPSAGTAVDRGEQVYRVDDRPVVLLVGRLPLYRKLADEPDEPDAQGQLPRGADVDLVAANLAALGFYDGATVDAVYDWTLAQSVEDWQESLGVPRTGAVDPAEVLVAAGPVRIDGVSAHPGDPAAEDVLTVTHREKVITLHAPVDLAGSLATGTRVRVTLPDGARVRGRVHTVGSAEEGSDGAPPSVPVVVEPRHPKMLAHAALGPVSASVVTAARHDVLHVPVAALLALSGGGYAVQRPDESLVPVTIGMVADGEVEVEGVPAGTEVVVAR